MPAYPFSCGRCGPFEVSRGIAAAADPARCPTCGADGRRVWTAPLIARTPAWKRGALDREERSAHEPEVVAAPHGRPLPHHHHHGSRAPTPWAVAGH